MEANSRGGQGSRRAVAPSNDDDHHHDRVTFTFFYLYFGICRSYPLPAEVAYSIKRAIYLKTELQQTSKPCVC